MLDLEQSPEWVRRDAKRRKLANTYYRHTPIPFALHTSTTSGNLQNSKIAGEKVFLRVDNKRKSPSCIKKRSPVETVIASCRSILSQTTDLPCRTQPDSAVARRIGPSSLVEMCLRRLPTYFEEEQDGAVVDDRAGEGDEQDLTLDVYRYLDRPFAGYPRNRHLTILVRAHAAHLLTKALERDAARALAECRRAQHLLQPNGSAVAALPRHLAPSAERLLHPHHWGQILDYLDSHGGGRECARLRGVWLAAVEEVGALLGDRRSQVHAFQRMIRNGSDEFSDELS